MIAGGYEPAPRGQRYEMGRYPEPVRATALLFNVRRAKS